MVKARQPWDDAPDGTNHERFLVRVPWLTLQGAEALQVARSRLGTNPIMQVTMREVQGGIIGSACFIILFAISGML